MDLSKAFDCLPHQLLVAKLKSYGVCGISCALIWPYLSGRKQRVRIGSSTIEWLFFKNRVQQGSVLGPVLFNIFINGLYAAINNCDLYSYTDDNTISACCDSNQQVIDTLMTESNTAMTFSSDNTKSCTDLSRFKSAIETWQERQCKCQMCRSQVDFLSCFIYVFTITCLLCLHNVFNCIYVLLLFNK